MTPERLAELMHYVRRRFAPTPQDAEAFRDLLAYIHTLTTERDALRVERDDFEHRAKREWQSAQDLAKSLVAAEARALELERERDQWERNHEALQDKFDCNKTCGCAYDFADALCGYHSPRVIAAEARALAAREEALEEAAKVADDWVGARGPIGAANDAGMSFAAQKIAEIIRALAQPKEPTK